MQKMHKIQKINKIIRKIERNEEINIDYPHKMHTFKKKRNIRQDKIEKMKDT